MKRFAFIILTLIMVILSIPYVYGDELSNGIGKKAFVDIDGHWAEATISKIAKLGLVNGVGDNRFQPDANMTRVQFATLLHKTLGLQIRYFRACDINGVYKDVSNDAWYSCMLYDLVTTGIVDDKIAFRPETPIIREEMAHYIIKAYQYKKGVMLKADYESLDKFNDRASIKQEYAEDVCKAVSLGLLKGKEGNMFQPGASTTRAEVMVVIDRFINSINTDNE